MASPDLSKLVRLHTLHSFLVRHRIILDRNLRGHATHGVDASSMASLDQKLDVSIHERHRHGDLRPVREDKVGVVSEFLDDAEDVVPPPTVETRRVVAQLVDDLLHLESREDGLDQHGSADRATGHAAVVLREVECIVPEAGLEVGLHLGQVEVWAESPPDGLMAVMEEVEAKVEERARHWLAINKDMLLLEVPTARPDDESRWRPVSTEFVLLGSQLEVNLPPDGVIEVNLARDHVFPCWRGRIWRNELDAVLILNGQTLLGIIAHLTA